MKSKIAAGYIVTDIEILLELIETEGRCSGSDTFLDYLSCEECPVSKKNGRQLSTNEVAEQVCTDIEASLRHAKRKLSHYSPARILEAKLKRL